MASFVTSSLLDCSLPSVRFVRRDLERSVGVGFVRRVDPRARDGFVRGPSVGGYRETRCHYGRAGFVRAVFESLKGFRWVRSRGFREPESLFQEPGRGCRVGATHRRKRLASGGLHPPYENTRDPSGTDSEKASAGFVRASFKSLKSCRWVRSRGFREPEKASAGFVRAVFESLGKASNGDQPETASLRAATRVRLVASSHRRIDAWKMVCHCDCYSPVSVSMVACSLPHKHSWSRMPSRA